MTALVTKHLPLLSDAPDGIMRFRQLIVDLAVSGKLIPQGSTDDWPQAQLSDIVTSFQNGVSSRGAANGRAVAVLRLADIKSGEISLEDLRTLVLDAEIIEKYLLVDGDMLVIRVNGSADLVGRFIVHRESGGALHCDHFIRLRLDRERVEPRFLKLIGDCSSTRASIRGLFVSTAGQKTVNQGHIGSLAVPLPPLAKQHRIIAKVDELMALCDRLEADQADAEADHAQLVQALLDSLTQATDAADFRASWQRLSEHFHTLFTTESSIDALKQTVLQLAVMGKLADCGVAADPPIANLPPLATEDAPFGLQPHWQWVRLGAICDLVTSGSRGWKEYYADSGSVFIRSQDIKADKLEFDNKAFVQLPPSAEGARTLVAKGDLLITITGANVGKAAHITEDIYDAYVSQHVALVRLKDARVGQYLHRWLINSYGGRALLLASSYGAKPGLNLQNIKDLPVPLPPIVEQHRIVAKVDELMALCDQLKAQLAEARQQHAQLATVLVEQAVA
ncbi:MAG: hypothetical protein RI907_3809 [Pseudomonadota bacterium]|jgi:type I restriction enzyme S subunit